MLSVRLVLLGALCKAMSLLYTCDCACLMVCGVEVAQRGMESRRLRNTHRSVIDQKI